MRLIYRAIRDFRHLCKYRTPPTGVRESYRKWRVHIEQTKSPKEAEKRTTEEENKVCPKTDKPTQGREKNETTAAIATGVF